MTQFVRISTGQISLEKEKELKLVTDEIMGRIEKVLISYGDNCGEEINIKIVTSDDEEILNVTGTKNTLFYPRNWSAMNQSYTAPNVMSETTTPTSERYACDDSLNIIITGSGVDEIINFIEIMIDGEVTPLNGVSYEEFESVEKADAAITSTTTGVFNPIHGRRRRMEKYMTKVLSDLIKEEKVSISIEKQTEGIKDMSEFISDSLFDKQFDGISKTVSERIKDYLVRALTKGYSPQRMIDRVSKEKGIDKIKAEVIVRTEIQALQNAVREWSYGKIDPDEKFKYKWIGPSDDRTTKICTNIKSRTLKGVLLSELKEIVNEESIKGGFDASREYTPHIKCRHTFVKVV